MESLVATLKHTFRRHLPGLAASIYEFIPRIFLNYTILSGFLDGKRIKVLFLGIGERNRYYYRFLFDNGLFEKSQSGLWFPSMKRFFPLLDADIIVTQYPQSNAKYSLITPSHIRAVLPIEGTFEDYLKSLKKSGKSSVSKIKKQGFEYKISSDESDFSRFYNEMHKPMIEARHGNCLLCLDYPTAESFFKQGFLLFIKKEGKDLGGLTIMKQKRRIVLKSLGVLNGSFPYTKMGVNVAAIYFSIKLAFENDYEEVDMGICSPFYTDGVLLFKKRWGSEIVQERSAHKVYFHFKTEDLKQKFYRIKRPILNGEVRMV